MHGYTQSCLGGLQIDPSRLALFILDHPCDADYFACDFLVDRVESFFPCVLEDASSSGRERQIAALTSTNS